MLSSWSVLLLQWKSPGSDAGMRSAGELAIEGQDGFWNHGLAVSTMEQPLR